MGLKDKLEFLRKKYEENGCRKFTNEEIAKYTEFVLLFLPLLLDILTVMQGTH
jgi:hypothetical protein